jgi:hypothetical protein
MTADRQREETTMETCLVCEGPLALLGGLGDKVWCRCIRCGIDQIVTGDIADYTYEDQAG